MDATDNTGNTGNTGTGQDDAAQGQQCANCGMEKGAWMGNNGQGVQLADKTYCCMGCATGTGCTC